MTLPVTPPASPELEPVLWWDTGLSGSSDVFGGVSV